MNCPRKRVGWAAGLTLLPAVLAGCMPQGGLERIPVSGRVTFDGKPLVDGLIRFVPDVATAASATILNRRLPKRRTLPLRLLELMPLRALTGQMHEAAWFSFSLQSATAEQTAALIAEIR